MKLRNLLLVLGLSLIPFSFSFAGLQEFEFGQLESVYSNSDLGYDLRLTANANFLTNDLYKVVQFRGDSSTPRIWSFFRNGSGMYVVVYADYNNSYTNSIKIQGFMNYVSIVDYSTININYAVSPGWIPISDFIENSIYSNPDKLLLGGYGNLQTASLCFVYSDIDKAVCFSYNDVTTCSSNPNFCENGVNKYITDSLNLDSKNISDLASIATTSPFTVITPPPAPDVSDIIVFPNLTGTNNEVYNAFLKRGYYRGLCYADYYTGNLVQSGDYISDLFQGDLDDSTYYGDSVFDFYHFENSNLSTHSWSQQRYYLMKYTYEQNNLSPFIGYNKGTWNIMFNIYNNQFNDNFSWIDYWTFCNMTVNGFNNNDIFTGDISDSMNSYIERVRSEETFVLSGVDFSGASDMLGLFNQLYTRAKSVFLLDSTHSNVVGILPTYIIFGFFLFLLLYGLKR